MKYFDPMKRNERGLHETYFAQEVAENFIMFGVRPECDTCENRCKQYNAPNSKLICLYRKARTDVYIQSEPAS